MAEAPLTKLARILGGVALSYGPLGHQVLGQLLTLNTKEVEVAAATALISAASRQRNAALYAAVRILGPAVALHWMTQREEKRLGLLWQRLEEKDARLSQREATLDNTSSRAGIDRVNPRSNQARRRR